MRKYPADVERAIRVERMVLEWTRSGLLEKTQEQRILSELKVNLRRTNVYFRLILLGFGILILLSAALLVGVTLKADSAATAMVFFVCAAASWGVAESLITSFRLYRFGIEEASAVTAGIFAAVGAFLMASTLHLARPGESSILVALIVGAGAGLAIYLRFGFVYAAILSMLCITAAPFQAGLTPVSERVIAAGLLLIVFVFAHSKHRQCERDFPADEYSVIQAIAWLGSYGYLNLHLTSVASIVTVPVITGWFYWFTFVAIWVLPGIGLFLAIRERDRLLLDCSIVLSLVTLATNKPYLGAARQTWDPILLGVFLIGTAVVLRRWLSARDRGGLTAERILFADKRGLAVVGTASAALHTLPQMPADGGAAQRGLDPGGGRSGGAGASGSF